MLRCFWRRQRMRSLFCHSSWVSFLGHLRIPADSVSSLGEFEPIPKHHVFRAREIIGTKLETDWEAAVFVDCVSLRQLLVQGHIVDDCSGFRRAEARKSTAKPAGFDACGHWVTYAGSSVSSLENWSPYPSILPCGLERSLAAS